MEDFPPTRKNPPGWRLEQLFVKRPCPSVCLSAGAWTPRWRCCPTRRHWRRRRATARTGRTPSQLSCWPRSARGTWTGRLSYTVRGGGGAGTRNRNPGPVNPFCLSPPPELFTTEVSHLRTLRVLDQVFFQKMRSVLSSEELACIFPNLPQVYELHGQSPPPPARNMTREPFILSYLPPAR